MFWVLVGVICGIYVAQEYPTLPRLQPWLSQIYRKITNNNEHKE